MIFSVISLYWLISLERTLMNKYPKLFKSPIFYDKRGNLGEVYRKKNKDNFKFIIQTTSKKNVFRGFHFQKKFQQSKYIYLLKGQITDIAINLKKNSKNFGKVYKFNLKPGLLLHVPKDYAHGIGFLDKENILVYHLSEYRYPEYEKGLAYNDKNLKINWKIKRPILSPRDKKHPTIKEIFIEK